MNTVALLLSTNVTTLNNRAARSVETLIYGSVPNDEDEKNSDLLKTVVESISEGNVVIKRRGHLSLPQTRSESQWKATHFGEFRQ